MKSIELLQRLRPETRLRIAAMLSGIDCSRRGTVCPMCPDEHACAFLNVLYHDLKGEDSLASIVKKAK